MNGHGRARPGEPAGEATMERSGLEAIFFANRGPLLRFLAAHGAGEAAEDLLQELWLKIAAVRPGPIDSPMSYLYRAANNLILDRYRSERQAARRNQDWTDAVGATVAGRSDDPSGDRRLIARQELERVQGVLDSIGPRAAGIFRRHRIDGVGQREIAQELGVSLSTIESDLRKAYRALADMRGAIE